MAVLTGALHLRKSSLHLRKNTFTFAQKKPYVCAKKYLHLRNQMGIKVKQMEKKVSSLLQKR